MWLKLKRIIPMLLGVLCLGSLAACEEDVSSYPRFKHFIGRRYEVIQPIFLAKVGNELAIVPPGWNEKIPISVQSYLDHPNNWWETREYLGSRGHIALPDEMYVIIGVIPIHTVLCIKHIVCKTGGFLGDYINVIGVIEDVKFNKYEVSFNGAMTNQFGSEACPQPCTEFIREICAP